MINKHKKGCTTLNYIEHFLILVFAVAECTSISVLLFYLVSLKKQRVLQ